MKRLLFFLLVTPIFLFSQTTDWVQSFGGTASDKGISIGTDSLGFIYCSGFFNNEATFGSITLTNSPLSTWGNNKENFSYIICASREFYEGVIIWAYGTLLAREPSTQEIDILMQNFYQNHDFQWVQRQIMQTAEYAHF